MPLASDIAFKGMCHMSFLRVAATFIRCDRQEKDRYDTSVSANKMWQLTKIERQGGERCTSRLSYLTRPIYTEVDFDQEISDIK